MKRRRRQSRRPRPEAAALTSLAQPDLGSQIISADELAEWMCVPADKLRVVFGEPDAAGGWDEARIRERIRQPDYEDVLRATLPWPQLIDALAMSALNAEAARWEQQPSAANEELS